ncbi:MAG: hypothetical protein J5824_05885 [Lachnospiraceae bacterium]|nr:hypothetical protein [Lachnospiraceae bacterium]
MKREINPEVKRERINEIKKTLKSMIFPIVLLAVIGIAVLLIVKYGAAVEDEPQVVPEKYEGSEEPIILENDKLKLTMDPLTTNFTLLVKESGKVWTSSVPEADADPIAQMSEKGKLKSEILLNHTTQNGLDTLYDSYSYSTSRGIYDIEAGSDYITIHYSLGDIEREYLIPPVLTEDRFKELTKDLDMNKKFYIQGMYTKYDLKKVKDEEKKADLLAKYPMIENEPIYVLEAASGGKPSLENLLLELGYTQEQYEADKALVNLENTSDKPIFRVDVTYRLDGGDLIAEVPFSSIESPSSYRVTNLTVLPYFGAAGKDKEGFLFVPEGGGALINFNNGRNSQNNYFANVYGRDICLKKNDLVHDTRAYYNLFGISEGNDSFICLIEEGASYAGIQADISGRVHSYNFVNALYTIKAREQYDVGQISSSDIYGFNETLPMDEKLVQRYRFINSGSYVDMAKVYGNYLKDKYGSYLTLNNDTDAPVVFEIIGAADKVRQMFGIPVSRPLELTSFEQAQEIMKNLTEDGIKNISVRLSGWCNGGVNQRVLSKTKVLSQLGGKKGLSNLSKAAQDLGITLYLNGITQYAYDSDLFDGFFSYTDAAKFVGKQRAELHIFSSVTYALREGTDSYYLLHPDKIYEMMDNLKAAADKYNAGIAYEDTGMDLSSDFYRKNVVSREKAKNTQADKLKSYTDSGNKQLVTMGNDYTVPYVDMIVETDLSGSQYTILDKNVPFFQLALHGYVNYTGEPLNICGNLEDELLYSAEYGAGLMFTIMHENSFILQDTLYTMYYGCEYANWRERIKEIYTRYNNELGGIFNQEMTNHEKLTSEVSCTEYADGTKVYVNYSYADYTAPDGTLVPARNYKAVK